jgi:hypothetical protein
MLHHTDDVRINDLRVVMRVYFEMLSVAGRAVVLPTTSRIGSIFRPTETVESCASREGPNNR